MLKPKGEWREHPGRYTSGEFYRLGKIDVAEVSYMSARRKDDPHCWSLRILLPCIKPKQETYVDKDVAKAAAERIVRTWFAWIDDA